MLRIGQHILLLILVSSFFSYSFADELSTAKRISYSKTQYFASITDASKLREAVKDVSQQTASDCKLTSQLNRDGSISMVCEEEKTQENSYTEITRASISEIDQSRLVSQATSDGCQLTSQVNPDGSISMVCVNNSPTEYSNSDITSWYPSPLGNVSEILTLQGYNMPQMQIKIGNVILDTIEATPSLITLRLPSYEIVGALSATRLSDGQVAVLEADYQVRSPLNNVKAFDYFQSVNNGFDWTRSYLMAKSAMTVYDDSTDFQGNVTERFEGMGLEVDYANDTNIFGVDLAIAHNDDIVLVAIRGTQMSEDWQDVAVDGMHLMIPAPLNWGYFSIHSGFYAAASSVFGIIKDTVSPLLNDSVHPRKLWITGHSLGGAVTSLVAYQLEVVDRIAVEGVHTFGSPRVGNTYWMVANGMTGLADKTWRWAAEGDTVSTLPFYDMTFYLSPKPLPGQIYFHVGKVNTLFANGNISIDGAEQIYIELNPLELFNGLFDEHMSYAPIIHAALESQIEEDIYSMMPVP